MTVMDIVSVFGAKIGLKIRLEIDEVPHAHAERLRQPVQVGNSDVLLAALDHANIRAVHFGELAEPLLRYGELLAFGADFLSDQDLIVSVQVGHVLKS